MNRAEREALRRSCELLEHMRLCYIAGCSTCYEDGVLRQPEADTCDARTLLALLDEVEALEADLSAAQTSYVDARHEMHQARARVAELEKSESIVWYQRLREPSPGDCGHLMTAKLCRWCWRIEKLEAERDELRFRLTKQQEARAGVEAERDQAQARVAELEAIPTINFYTAQKDERIATLEAALRKYGRHLRGLPHPCMYPDGDCTCGLDAALAGGG